MLLIALQLFYIQGISVDWSGDWRLQREQQCKDGKRKFTLPRLKAPQERSDEEIEAVPAESVRSERKSTVGRVLYVNIYS